MPKKNVGKTKKKSSRFAKMMAETAVRQQQEDAQQADQSMPEMQDSLSGQENAINELAGSLGNRETEDLLRGTNSEEEDMLVEAFFNRRHGEENHAKNMEDQINEIRQPEMVPDREEAPRQETHPLDQLQLIQSAQAAADGKQFKPVRKEYQTIGFMGKMARAVGHVLFSPLTLVQTLWNSAKRGVRKASRAFVRWKNGDGENENPRQNDPEEGQDAGLLREQGSVPPRSALEQAVEDIREGDENQEILTRLDHQPMMWEEFIAEDPEMSPYITVDLDQENERSPVENTSIAHASLALHYTRYDDSTGEKERCKVKFGFWPGAGMYFTGSTLIQMGRGAMVPGQLKDDMLLPVSVGKRYGANNRQINQILREAESYASGGFNMLKRNCTTFVAELTQNAGLPTQDILQENTLDLGAGWLVTPLLPVLAAVREGLGFDTMKRLMQKENNSYGHRGQNMVNQEEYDRFHEATDNLQPMSAYSPKAAAERIRRGEVTLLHANDYAPAKIDKKTGEETIIEDFAEGMRQEKEVLYGKIRAVADNKVDADIEQLDAKISAAIESYNEKRMHIADLKEMLMSYQSFHGQVDEKGVHKRCNALRRQIISELQELREYVSGWYYGVVGGDNRLMIPFLHLVSIMERSETQVNHEYKWQEGGNENRDVSPHLANLQKKLRITYTGPKWDQAGEETDSKTYRTTVNGIFLVGLARTYGSALEGLRQTDRYAATNKDNVKDKAWFRHQTRMIYEYNTTAQKAMRGDFFREGLTEEDVEFAFSTLPEAMRDISKLGDSGSFYEQNGVAAYQALAYEKVFGGMANKVKELRKEYALTSDDLYDALAGYILDCALDHREYFGMILRGIQKTVGSKPTPDKVFGEFITNFFWAYLQPVLAMVDPDTKTEETYRDKITQFMYVMVSGMNSESRKLPEIHKSLKELVTDLL